MSVFGDIKDGINGGLKAGGDLIDAGKKKLGEGVDYVSDKTGALLDEVGLDKAGDWVHNAGDHVAAGLGATPTEQGLGHTDDPTQLVHGNPGHIRESAKHLADFHAAFDRVGQGMRKVHASGWTGEGGDAFRRTFEMHPTKWLHAADACEDAAKALVAYAEAIKWAQDKAQDAIDLWKKAEHTSKSAVEAYNKKVDVYNAKVKADEDPGPKPDPFHDPGDAQRKEAENLLEDARRGRNEAAGTADAAIKAALAHAPAEPPPLDQIGGNLGDLYKAGNIERTHLLGGVVKGTAGLLNFARGLNPTDPYNLTHPAAYYQNVSMTLSGLVSTGTHPERIVTAAVDGFKNDPSEFFGRLLPELAGTKGAGFAKSGMRLAMREGVEGAASGVASKGLRYGDDLGKAGAHADDALQGAPKLSMDDFDELRTAQKHAVASGELYDGALTFPDQNAAISYGRNVWNDYADSLPEGTKKSLFDYSDEKGAPNPAHATYKEMNGYLRGNTDLGTPDVLRNIENTDKALAGTPVPQDITVVRGTGTSHMGAEAPDDLIGRQFTDDGYMSTSLGDNGAVGGFGGSDAILHLRVPEGTPAMWMENVSKFGMGERELLLGRGTTYQVTRAFEENGQWHVYGEVLPRN
ncbi:putative T7SS-secreted protein [Streptomyces sp. NPDC052225]|uniref:putative T7SS-secreted protein n=1 Tax=Streptomyces sp. NPDC052225 TaxID=3154949 RepID=UPI0034272F43